MATFAALGKASAASPITAAAFQQKHFYGRQTRSSWSPRLYFQDDLGNTLAFIRNIHCQYSQEIRVFTDPTLSFELLAIRPASHADDADQFTVTDSLTRELAGTIYHRHIAGELRQEWSLHSASAEKIVVIGEDSGFLALLRRYLTELIPQSYTFYVGSRAVGSAIPGNMLWAHTMEIDLTGDDARLIDRRLLLAAVVLIMTGKRQGAHS
jgi:hypothetical protein